MMNSPPVRSDKNRGRRQERIGEGLVHRRRPAGGGKRRADALTAAAEEKPF
jgi:hypothetical protein